MVSTIALNISVVSKVIIIVIFYVYKTRAMVNNDSDLHKLNHIHTDFTYVATSGVVSSSHFFYLGDRLEG